jgi:hypothetical protein
MVYSLEKQMVIDFVNSLPFSPFAEFGPLKVATEFEYSRGRTDIIAMTPTHEIIAFEAKLTKWREALDQAYRNTCFANLSYVLLPKNIALRAIKYNQEFFIRCVGVCYINAGQVVIMQEAIKNDPLQIWLYQRAKNKITEGQLDDSFN